VTSEVSKYALESAYKDIERDALARTKRQEQPVAVLLGGQPGSGKSALAADAVHDLRAVGAAVVIDADRMREENPRYKQLSKEDPQHAADLTQKEAGQWAIRLTLAAVEGRRNLVVDGTMRNPQNMHDLASRLKDSGYKVEARVMAVDAETSMLRARLRFEHQAAERGTGRFVNREQHDAAYTGMAESLRTLERGKLVESMRLYDANQRPVYDNQIENGQWVGQTGAAEALQQERTREWTHAQRVDYVAALGEVYALATRRENVQGTAPGATLADRDALADKLAAATKDLARYEQSPVFARAKAFEQLPQEQASAKFPELRSAYAGLQAIEEHATKRMEGDTQRVADYMREVRTAFVQKLEQGGIPERLPERDAAQEQTRKAPPQRER